MPDVPCEEMAALLAEPLERFVEARAARAKALKAEGRKDGAGALAKARKPTRPVWVLGSIARSHPDLAAEAVQAADDLAAAQEAGEGDIRSPLGRFRDAVTSLAQVADRADDSTDGTTLALALRAVLADPTARRTWIDGCLQEVPREGGQGMALGPPGAARPPPDRDTRQPDVEEAQRRARAALEEMERNVERAAAEQEAAAGEVGDLERRRAALEEELTEARRRLESADKAHADATRRLDEARRFRPPDGG